MQRNASKWYKVIEKKSTDYLSCESVLFLI